MQNNIQMLAPSKKFTGEPVKIEREMNDEEERAAREAERRRREKERQILEAEKEAKSLMVKTTSPSARMWLSARSSLLG